MYQASVTCAGTSPGCKGSEHTKEGQGQVGDKAGTCRESRRPRRELRTDRGADGVWGREPSLSDGYVHGWVCADQTLKDEGGGGVWGGRGCLTQTWPCWWGGWPWGVEKRQGRGSIQRPDSVQVLRTMDSSGLALDAPQRPKRGTQAPASGTSHPQHHRTPGSERLTDVLRRRNEDTAETKCH